VDDEEFGRERDALLARLRESAGAPEGAGGTVERLPTGLAGCGDYGPALVGPDAGQVKGG
jgi:hypothetical protein